MKAFSKIMLLCILVVGLASCNAFALKSKDAPAPTTTSFPTSTSPVEPTATSSAQPPTPMLPTPTALFPKPVDRHDPEAVLRAYFDAWAQSNLLAQTSFMDEKFAQMTAEPVDSIRVLELQQVSSSPTERTYSVLFDIKVKGNGVSMQSGQVRWNYYLSWYPYRDSWLISNYGAG